MPGQHGPSGAEGSDAATGDGAGLLLQIPDGLLRAVGPWELPPAGSYGVAVCFLPRDAQRRAALEAVLEEEAGARGLRLLGWRDVPVEPEHLGPLARDSAPVIRQLAVAADRFDGDLDALERRLYVVRRAAESVAGPELVIPSCSARTVVYKGMLSAPQLEAFYPDLRDVRCASAVALLHARFSTNTFPSWKLAHPYRLIAHNGEVNTLTGNRNWMRAREGALTSSALGEDLATVLPVVDPDASDSATVDSAVELLVRAGRSVPHALKLLVPEAHEGRDDLPGAVRDFAEFHSLLMEPWDGPAIAFCDGRLAGAMLDRNGLRPGRWLQTRDGWVVCASEAGALEVDPADVVRRGRLEPGTLLVADLEAGRLLADREVERRLAQRRPYGRWYREATVRLEDLTQPGAVPAATQPLRRRQLAFGYTQEDLRVLVAPMAGAGKEPTGSMGADSALAVLSERDPPLFSYFKQLFAQVTNPAIDPLREGIVMSLGTGLGPRGNLLEDEPEEACQLVLDSPILRDVQLARVRPLDHPVLRTHTLDATWSLRRGASGLEPALQRLCAAAVAAVDEGATILVLSDRACAPDRVPIPSLLATAAVHHRLVRAGTRLRAGLVVESGEPREVHHLACLIGFGANAVNPYLLLESVGELLERPTRRRRVGGSSQRPPTGRRPRTPGPRWSTRWRPGCSRSSQSSGSPPSSPTAAPRPSRRSGWTASSWTPGSPTPPPGWAGWASTCWPTRPSPATRGPGPSRNGTCCPSAASTHGGATATATAGTPPPSPSSRTRSEATAMAMARRPTQRSAPGCARTPAGSRCGGC